MMSIKTVTEALFRAEPCLHAAADGAAVVVAVVVVCDFDGW